MFNTIEEAIQDMKKGKMIIVVDNEDRENEGDLMIASEYATPEAINFMAKYGRGLICVTIEQQLANKLMLKPMVTNNTDNHETAFTASIDHVSTTTGISAEERSTTILKMLESSNPLDFRRPGHVFPLVAKTNGVLERIGHTEAGVDMARLSGLQPSSVIVEIMKDDGTMARRDDLVIFAKEHGLKMITIKDLVNYRKRNEVHVESLRDVDMPTSEGHFRLRGFIDKVTGKEHLALIKGNPTNKTTIRIHSECLTGDVFGSDRCDCGPQLKVAMKEIDTLGEGIILYLRQEGRGIGLINKLRAYELQDSGLDTVDANLELGFEKDGRDYAIAAWMLKSMEIDTVNIMTNNPRKINQLEMYGIKVAERKRLQIECNETNKKYLNTKRDRLEHLLY